jgi:hypothetical protein
MESPSPEKRTYDQLSLTPSMSINQRGYRYAPAASYSSGQTHFTESQPQLLLCLDNRKKDHANPDDKQTIMEGDGDS